MPAKISNSNSRQQSTDHLKADKTSKKSMSHTNIYLPFSDESETLQSFDFQDE